jgi:hypothetical protein
MATSNYHIFTDLLHVVEQVKPKSILDVGIGFGILGGLYREVFELYYGRSLKERTVKIDGIEIFEKLKNPMWDLFYNQVFVGNALEIIDRLGRYELITAVEIIEHLEKDQGKILIDKMLKHADLVILTSPRSFIQPGEVLGNEYALHRSLWSKKDFAGIPILYKNTGFNFMVILSHDPQRLKSIDILNAFDVLGVKNSLRELGGLILKRAKKRTKGLLGKKSVF